MKNSGTSEVNGMVRRFIEEAGNATQSFGLGRAMGQVFAYLYFSPEPRNLADIQEALGISKGSASMTVRQLEQWGGVRQVWIKGDRKDYYAANDWFGKILKNALLDTIGKKMSSYATVLDEMESELVSRGQGNNGRNGFLKERFEHVRKFQRRAQKIWQSPLLQKLIK